MIAELTSFDHSRCNGPCLRMPHTHQPAFAAYSRASSGAPWTAHSIHVLALEGDLIARLTPFVKPGAPRLFDVFGLPLTLSDAPSPG